MCACVCVKINHSGFLRLPTAECRHGERLRALGQGGGRHPSGLPSPPRLPRNQARAAACKAIPSCQLVPWAACKPLAAAARGKEGFEPASCCGSPSRARHVVQALLKATSGPPSSTLTPNAASPGCRQQWGARLGAWAKVGLGHRITRALRVPHGGLHAWPGPSARGGTPRPGHSPQTRSWPWSLCPVAPSRAQQHPAPQLMLRDLLPPGPEGAAPLWFLGAGQNI